MTPSFGSVYANVGKYVAPPVMSYASATSALPSDAADGSGAAGAPAGRGSGEDAFVRAAVMALRLHRPTRAVVAQLIPADARGGALVDRQRGGQRLHAAVRRVLEAAAETREPVGRVAEGERERVECLCREPG